LREPHVEDNIQLRPDVGCGIQEKKCFFFYVKNGH
jgi:hypothetical protein